MKRNQAMQKGFSLVEMAVVLVILGFIIGALLLPLQAQRDNTLRLQTENQLELARKALIGFAQANGRLPCPATATGNLDAGSYGLESPLGGTTASTPNCATYVGYLPAATLGISPTDVSGFAIDAWNNRIRYAITDVDSSTEAACGGDSTPDFTTPKNMGFVGLSCLKPNLKVCAGTTSCATGYLINNAVAVIFSTGNNGALGDDGPDEIKNKTATITNPIFYSRTTQTSTAEDGKFDDLVVWISPYVLYNAMIQVGQLH
jgi:prepilin-type N-terminal cleavage/methylation domain-containing protein